VSGIGDLIAALGTTCAALPDRRRGPPGEGDYTMADIGLSAFAPFFMGSPSFLAHQRALQRGQGHSNCQTLFGMAAIPTDNYIRQMLDGVSPAAFEPLFWHAIDAAGLPTRFQCLGGRILIALDGTEYFCSRKIKCPNCSTRRAPMAGWNASMPSWAPPSSLPATIRCCRCRRNSSPRRTAPRSRTASAAPPSVGSPAMGR